MRSIAPALQLALVTGLLAFAPAMIVGQDVTRTVTTRTSTPELPLQATKTVVTETSTPVGAFPEIGTKTVTTQTLTAPVAPGEVTRTVTTKTTINSPALVHRGLFQIRGTNTLFWVDEFGIRHYVRDPDTVRALYMPNEPVYVVSKHEIRRLPTGSALTVARGPSFYLANRDESAVLLEKPRVIVEFGTGPTARRVEIHNLNDLKAVEDFDDLDDLSSRLFE